MFVQISTIRREDYEINKGHTEYEDLLQCDSKPKGGPTRGHQLAAAFMALASGLDKVGLR